MKNFTVRKNYWDVMLIRQIKFWRRNIMESVSNNSRPDFDDIQDYEEFSKYYWYQKELKKICREHALKTPSYKIELNKVIEAYFAGKKILPEKRYGKNKKPVVQKLTLDTGLIACNFTFGNKFREFFAKMTGKKHFKFNADMGATVKAVKENEDESFTLRDLLDIYFGRRVYAVYDRSALQWNKFVKDFCTDDATQIYEERLTIAAKLWRIVKDLGMPKNYSRELLEKYQDRL